MTPKPDDGTSMGGDRSVFPTTCWCEIRSARTSSDARQREVIDRLIKTYWKPVYCYLRHKGYANAQAKDLTQGFFHNVVLRKDLFKRADEAKGRFRSLLLTALNNYVTSMYRHGVAEKRRPEDGVVSLQDFDEASLVAIAKTMSPDDAFTYIWASVLLQDVLTEVEQRCSKDDKTVHWQVFHARILLPIMAGTEPESLAELCRRFGIESTARAANMVVTVKRRFQTAIKDRIRQYVDLEEEVEQEIRDLMMILSKQRAS